MMKRFDGGSCVRKERQEETREKRKAEATVRFGTTAGAVWFKSEASATTTEYHHARGTSSSRARAIKHTT
jgi:hypothetical protein